MTKSTKILGFLVGAAVAVHGCVLAVSGGRLLPATTRGGSQHYWSALVGIFGDRGASFVSGVVWLSLGLAIIYFCVVTKKHVSPESKPPRRSSKRKKTKRRWRGRA